MKEKVFGNAITWVNPQAAEKKKVVKLNHIVSTNNPYYTAWKEGMFYFKDMPLGEILKTIARWYDVEVFYVNAGVQGIVYNGKMPMYSGIGDVLRKFELSGEVRFELNGRTLTVYEK